jgi:hypothetical protein
MYQTTNQYQIQGVWTILPVQEGLMVDESAIFEAPKLPASHWPALVVTTWISGDASPAKLSSIDHIQWLITFIT